MSLRFGFLNLRDKALLSHEGIIGRGTGSLPLANQSEFLMDENMGLVTK